MREHVLYKTGDPDAPEIIKDRNGEVVLGLCKVCGRIELELNGPCIRKVPARLEQLGSLYRERNALYRDNYKNFGRTLVGLFPDGITLKTAEEFNRFALFLMLVHKASRYAHSINNGGHEDSLDDTSVYAQMMAEYDEEVRARVAQTSSNSNNAGQKE